MSFVPGPVATHPPRAWGADEANGQWGSTVRLLNGLEFSIVSRQRLRIQARRRRRCRRRLPRLRQPRRARLVGHAG